MVSERKRRSDSIVRGGHSRPVRFGQRGPSGGEATPRARTLRSRLVRHSQGERASLSSATERTTRGPGSGRHDQPGRACDRHWLQACESTGRSVGSVSMKIREGEILLAVIQIRSGHRCAPRLVRGSSSSPISCAAWARALQRCDWLGSIPITGYQPVTWHLPDQGPSRARRRRHRGRRESVNVARSTPRGRHSTGMQPAVSIARWVAGVASLSACRGGVSGRRAWPRVRGRDQRVVSSDVHDEIRGVRSCRHLAASSWAGPLTRAGPGQESRCAAGSRQFLDADQQHGLGKSRYAATRAASGHLPSPCQDAYPPRDLVHRTVRLPRLGSDCTSGAFSRPRDVLHAHHAG